MFSFSKKITLPNSIVLYFDNSESSLINNQGLNVERFVRKSFNNGAKSIVYIDNGRKNKIDELDLGEIDFEVVSNTGSVVNEIENIKKQQPIESNYFFSDFQLTDPKSLDYSHFDSTRTYNIVVTENLNLLRNIHVDTLYIQPSQRETSEIVVSVIFKVWNIEKGNVIVKLMQGDRQLSSIVREISKLDQIQFDLPKISHGGYEIVIDGDEVIYDNIFHFIIPKQVIPKVGVVNAGKSKVLDVIYDKKELFRLNKQAINSPNYDRLKEDDLIVLNNIADIPSSLLDQFSNTHFIIFPSDSIIIQSYYDFMGLKIRKSESQLAEIDIDYLHPLLKGVFDGRLNNGSLSREYSYYDITGNYETIMKYRSGRPFLIKFGLFYFFNFILESEESTFQNNALFLPILYQIAFSATNELESSYCYPGDLITVSRSTSDVPVKIKNDTYEVIPTFHSNGDQLILEIPNDIRPNKYQLLRGNDTLKTIAVNIPRKESVMLSAEIDEWKKAFSDYENVNVISARENLDDWVSAMYSESSVSRYALILVILFILIEAGLHRYFK